MKLAGIKKETDLVRLNEHVKLVDCLYKLALGRPLESRSAAENHVGAPPHALLTNLVGSEEFRVRVAEPILRSEAPDPAWLAGSQADTLPADFLMVVGAENADILTLRDPLERLERLLSIPAAQLGLRQSIGERDFGQILESIRSDELAGLFNSNDIRLVTKKDIRNAYRLILAREPEPGALDNEQRLGIPVRDLLVGFFESLEFITNFVNPCSRGQQAASGYYQSISSDLRKWAISLAGAKGARDGFKNSECIGELADHLLRDESISEFVYAPEVKLYISAGRSNSSLWQTSTRPELARLGLSDYPAGFNWHAYLQHNPDAGATRWDALDHLLENPAPDQLPPTFERGKADFLSALGTAFVRRHDKYAAFLLHETSQLRPLSPYELELLGDTLTQEGLTAQALITYMESIKKSEPNLYIILKAAKAAIAVHKVADALSLLRQSKANFGEPPAWRDLLLPYFEAKLRLAADLSFSKYRLGERSEGDNILLEAASDIEAEFLELQPLGVPIQTDGLKRILLLAEINLPQCKHYRVDQKITALEKLGFKPELFSLGQSEEEDRTILERLAGADALIVYRYPAWPTLIKIIISARSLGVPVFFEIDDLIFDANHYPDTYESYGGQITYNTYVSLQFGVPLFKAAAQLCDYGIASTEPLARELRKVVRSGKVWVVPNSLDDRIERVAAMDLSPPKDGVTIFYGTGTRAHNGDFDDLVAPALLQTLIKYPQVRLLIVGYLTLPPAFEAFLSRIIKIDFVEPVDAYWRLLASADINIAVLNPSIMADCKSEIKWLEAAAFSIPSVVSPTAAYRQALKDGHDVLFADTPQAWSDAFERLIADTKLRSRIGRTAKASAQARFSQQVAAQALATCLDSVRSHRKSARAKPRLMLANVYFPPQTIGGATRVLKDNIDAFIDFGLCDEFDLAILTTDAGVQSPGEITVDSYRGLPVFRISTPEEVNMDWRPSNPSIGALFSRIHDLWKPDIMHFHCIQRLTGSIVDTCRQNNTPYLITAHDAWWISDYQFLTNEMNQIIDPSVTAVAASPPRGITESQSRSRTLYLRSLLERAYAVLCVSKSFSDIYISAGIKNIRAVPNGLPRLTIAPKRPSPDGRVRLAHVGNVTAHKGFPLVRRALMEGRFANLRLTAVDHSRRPGEKRIEIWGETEVQIVGPVQQSTMAALYADHDVLLAPSTWPESFGLVTREALAAGLWVVASNRGAIGEDVTPGVNGFVVDVVSHLPLQNALAEINENYNVYLNSPPPTELRSSDDQARDLIGLYREIVEQKRLKQKGANMASYGRP
jgi:glycosyltransferase involved in cell wall biosynthesis